MDADLCLTSGPAGLGLATAAGPSAGPECCTPPLKLSGQGGRSPPPPPLPPSRPHRRLRSTFWHFSDFGCKS